jgi:hypothetical protein
MRQRFATALVLLAVLPSLAAAQSVATVHTQSDRIVASPDVSAVQSGTWSDPQTWGGAVPGDRAKVAIPAGLTVTIDRVITTAYDWIRVDGTLRFASDVNTQLVAETFVVMGRYEQVVNCGVTSKLIFRSLGPIDHAVDKDPLELTRGLIAMTPVLIQGCAKKEISALVGFPAAGDTRLTLAADPDGWAVGDAVLVLPTLWGQDEVVTVTAIVGRTITFTPALTFTRTNHPDDPLVTLHVGNLTRNVVIRTDHSQAGPQAVCPAMYGLTPPRRPCLQGHIMLMGGGHRIANAAFLDLGRTTIDPVTDPRLVTTEAGIERDPSIGPECVDFNRENVRSRYALHFHNPGPASELSIVEGVVVDVQKAARLKIGINNHSGYVAIRRAITHNVAGSHVFLEEGDERGEIVDSLMIASEGLNAPKPTNPGNPCIRDKYPEVNQRRRLDFGFKGAGVWSQGAGNVLIARNVMAGHTQAGIEHASSGLDRRLTNTFRVLVRPDHMPDGYAWLGSSPTLAVFGITPSVPTLIQEWPPFTMVDNQMYAIGNTGRAYMKSAIWSEGTGLKQPEASTRPKNLIARTVAWNVARCIFMQYSSWNRLEDVTCLGGTQYPKSPQEAGGEPHLGISLILQGGVREDYVRVRVDGGFSTGRELITTPLSRFAEVTINGRPYLPTLEACDDGIDNDGDGMIDEDCTLATTTVTLPTPPPDAAQSVTTAAGMIFELLEDHAGSPGFKNVYRTAPGGKPTYTSGYGAYLVIGADGLPYTLGSDLACHKFTTGWVRVGKVAPCY